MLTTMDTITNMASSSDDTSSAYIGATIALAIIAALLLVGVVLCYLKQTSSQKGPGGMQAIGDQEMNTNRKLNEN